MLEVFFRLINLKFQEGKLDQTKNVLTDVAANHPKQDGIQNPRNAREVGIALILHCKTNSL